MQQLAGDEFVFLRCSNENHTVTLLFVIANALILKHVLTYEQVPQQIASAMLSAELGPIIYLIVVNIILLIGGQFMEPSGLLVIVAPLVFPIAMELGGRRA